MSLFSYLAAISSLAIVLQGYPSQIISNWRRKSCEGLSLSLFILLFCASTFWSLHGWSKRDWFLIVSQVPGVALTLVILMQCYVYRKAKKLAAP
jgi:uncharacterized protein with PQ loop repeat